MRPSSPLRLIDRYLLLQMAPPMAMSFAVVLVSLLLYRMLQIFNMLAASTAQFVLASRLIGGLLPHYFGLALPAGYFISTFIVVMRMSDSSEVDALLACGLSLDRLLAPFLAVGAVVAAVSLLLLGYLQPYGRYTYNSGMNAALGSTWNGRLQARVFFRSDDGALVVEADKVDTTGRALQGVFVRRIDRDGQEQLFTAQRGDLAPSPDGTRIRLSLRDGMALQDRADSPTAGSFDLFTLEAPAAAVREPFRARGNGPRELTLPELWRRLRTDPSPEARRRAESEFNTRLVRTISPIFLPLLALPLGIAAKRARRSAGFIVAAATLMLYEYAIDGAQAAADLGGLAPVVAIWTPFALFAALCCALYASSRRRPGQNLLGAAVAAVEAMFEAVSAALRRPTPAASTSASR